MDVDRHSVIYTLPPDPYFLTHTRAFVCSTLRSWDLQDEAIHKAEAIVSELAANAIVHTKTPARLRLTLKDLLLIEVADASPNNPRVRAAPHDNRDHGLGLVIVEHLADNWGHHRTSTGKNVWCELITKPTRKPDRTQ